MIPTTTQQLNVAFGGKTYHVESIADAQAKWINFQSTADGGFSAGVSIVGNGVRINNQDGIFVARISFNGRVWDGEGHDANCIAEAPNRTLMPEGVRGDTANNYITGRETLEQAYKRSEDAARTLDSQFDNPNHNSPDLRLPKSYADYKHLTSTVDDHIAFLRVINREIDHPTGAGGLYERLTASVKVADAKFSQARHLTALEANSDGWDFDEVPDAVKVEIAQLSAKIKGVDSGYDLPHFTTGFGAMIEDLRERGVKLDADLHLEQVKPTKADSGSDYDPMSP